MYYTLAIVCLAFFCAWALAWLRTRRARACFAGLPSYPALPIVGNALRLATSTEAIYRMILHLSEKSDVEQKPFIFWFGPIPVIVVSDPDSVKQVTNTFIEKSFFYKIGRIWIGDGLVTATGSVWKKNIKKLAGTFVGPIVDGYQDVFNAQAHKLVGRLKAEAGKGPFDIMEKYLAFATLETICQTALGFPSSEQLVTTEYYQAFGRTLELLIARGINLLMHPDWVYQRTPMYKELVKCVEILHNVSNTVIARKRNEITAMKQNGTLKQPNIEDGQTKFRSFLDIILELSEADPSMTDDYIRAEVDTIIVGGQETTATTLMYSILMIGRHPRVQEKLYAELQSIFGDSKRPVEKQDLARMTYCEAVISESLRLHPPLPMVAREATHDLKLKQCTIPKGTSCIINAIGAGRSKNNWGPDALEFKPERWLNGSVIPAAAFLPFSYGKRSCIGKRYAMTLLKTLLAYSLRELEFVSEEAELKFKVDIALRPASGHFVEVRLRK
ncbi:cytochrome P450 4c21-like [Leguminivora glycinivorella]|uniref:cytochrome P450 4c21-like n=1 Tax=Leguminivora glycinivorella TaxID=1035111 RepID=UPI00200E690E|nr:cytochrome P450 4c21-like [Leguminivora glycinivorella]